MEAALPDKLRAFYRPGAIELKSFPVPAITPRTIVLQGLDLKARWLKYIGYIKETISANRSVIVLHPERKSLLRFKSMIESELSLKPAVLFRKEPQELEQWLSVKKGEVKIALGLRSAVFAPFPNLGAIIIDEEGGQVYKQDQTPHYHAKDVAIMRAKIEKADLILGASLPSLESFYTAKRNKTEYLSLVKPSDFPEIKIIDTKRIGYRVKGRKLFLAPYLEDAINSSLMAREKILIISGRKGFATLAACPGCGLILKCPRCSVNLVYYFKENTLSCHYCNFKMNPPDICPQCNCGYIKYSGSGTEKVESELARIYPQARLQQVGAQVNGDLKQADIFVATKYEAMHLDTRFDLIAVLGIDSALNRADFRAAEKSLSLLSRILGLTLKKVIIQTNLAHHHIFKALTDHDFGIFYNEELKQRRQLGFPPFRHFALVKLRGGKEARVQEAAESLFEGLKKASQDKKIKVLSLNPGQPAKLRGNFYWQILMASGEPKKISRFLKIYLKDFRHSGIIVTVDVDPI
jgi:primosomal protein N' (replication factor Y)